MVVMKPVSPSINRGAVTSCIFELYDLSPDRGPGPVVKLIAHKPGQGARSQGRKHFLFDNVS